MSSVPQVPWGVLVSEEIVDVFFTTSQRDLVWAMVQRDSIGQVYSIVSDDTIDSVEKTKKIVLHLDFLFEIRTSLKTMPKQGGKITLSILDRAYLTALLETTDPGLLSLEVRVNFKKDVADLQMKMGDAKEAFLLPYVQDSTKGS
jgi:hypothetical protein